MSNYNQLPIEIIATSAADAIVKHFEGAGFLTTDLRTHIKSALLTYWNAGKREGSRSEIQNVIALLQGSASDIKVLVPTSTGQFQTVALNDILLGRVYELEEVDRGSGNAPRG